MSAVPQLDASARLDRARPGFLSQLSWILRKDLLVEWRSKARVFALAIYALTMMLLFSFAIGPNSSLLEEHAAAYLWLSILAVSTLLLAQSFQIELESGALEGLTLIPVDPRSLFYGKALANWALLMLLSVLSLPALVVLYNAEPVEGLLPLLGVLALGSAGVSAPGTLYAGLTARLPAQQLLLPVLLFPLVVPAILASVKASSLILLGDPMGQAPSWIGVLICFDLIYWSLCGLLFEKIIQD